ncbi:MAG: protein kinase [Deltaproteobacteria bacterium]|nr:protein kinase [Deltaproteobacteria bacterium]
MSEEIPQLCADALGLDKSAVARVLSLFEDQRPEAIDARIAISAELIPHRARRATVLGLTGTPGSGKSSLLARLAPMLIAGDPKFSVAVLAVDPSSQISGGALLGDRTRMRAPPGEKRLFFRSQASATALGGLGPSTFQACRALSWLFDCVLIETVGVGQAESDIRHLADRVYLVLQPLAGDEVQFLKAGILEVPHAFVLNKCDEPSAQRSAQALRATIGLARPDAPEGIPTFETSARTGAGLPSLLTEFQHAIARGPVLDDRTRDAHFFNAWVQDEWGRRGVAALQAAGGAGPLLSRGFDQAQREFDRAKGEPQQQNQKL